MPVTAKQIQALDRIAIEKIGIPSVVLMENAGRAVAQEVLGLLRGKRRRGVCVFCGPGNNGGDGFVAARHLLLEGRTVKVFLIGDPKKLKGDAALNFGIFRRLGGPIRTVKRLTAAGAARAMIGCDVIVDALFGVGLNRDLREPFRGIIEQINASEKPVIAVDVPSGLNATTGETFGVCIKAARTVTFTCSKRGFLRNEGLKHTGKVIVADIGIPKQLIRKI